MKLLVKVFLVLVIVAALAVVFDRPLPKEVTQNEERRSEGSLPSVGDSGGNGPDAEAIAAVKRTFRQRMNISRWETAPLRGGVAVLAGEIGAYWVRWGKVYAGNGMAMTWSPGLEQSPLGVDIDGVTRAVRGQLRASDQSPPSWDGATGPGGSNQPIIVSLAYDVYHRRGARCLEFHTPIQMLGYPSAAIAARDGFRACDQCKP